MRAPSETASRRSPVAGALTLFLSAAILLFAGIALVLALRPPVPTSTATYMLGASVLLLGSLAAGLVLRVRTDPTFVLVAMFIGGALAIAVGLLHILFGARLSSPTGLWAEGEPWPGAFTTVGGTLIGFASILWSLNRQQAFASLERFVGEYQRDLETISESIAAVELLLTDSERLSRQAFRILQEVVEPFGRELLNGGQNGEAGAPAAERAPLFRILESVPPPQREHPLGVCGHPNHGWAPVTTQELQVALDDIAFKDPALANSLRRELDGLCMDFVLRTINWAEDYREVRRRLTASLPEAPVDLLPFADDLEMLLELRVAATTSQDPDALEHHRQAARARVMHLAIILAALADRTVMKLRPGAARAASARSLLGVPVSTIAEHLRADAVSDATRRGYAEALIVEGTAGVCVIDLDWHWTQAFCAGDDVGAGRGAGDVAGDAESDRPDDIDDSRARQDAVLQDLDEGEMRVLVRTLIAPDLRRALKASAFAARDLLVRDLKMLERGTDAAVAAWNNHGFARSIKEFPRPREFWKQAIQTLGFEALSEPHVPLLRDAARGQPPAARGSGDRPGFVDRIDAWSRLGQDRDFVAAETAPMDWGRVERRTDGPPTTPNETQSDLSPAVLLAEQGDADDEGAAGFDWMDVPDQGTEVR